MYIVIYITFHQTDSLANQEGGAMYISCGDDGTGVESEMGYVPNNPLFGLPLDSPQVNLLLTTSPFLFDIQKKFNIFHQIKKKKKTN